VPIHGGVNGRGSSGPSFVTAASGRTALVVGHCLWEIFKYPPPCARTRRVRDLWQGTWPGLVRARPWVPAVRPGSAAEDHPGARPPLTPLGEPTNNAYPIRSAAAKPSAGQRARDTGRVRSPMIAPQHCEAPIREYGAGRRCRTARPAGSYRRTPTCNPGSSSRSTIRPCLPGWKPKN
jgi:hypothetical protein